MENQDIAALMTQYLELKTQAVNLEADKRKLVQDALLPEVRQRVEEIEAEFAGKSEQAEAALAELEEKIKDAVVSARSNVAVEGMKASYHSGRVTWDSKAWKKPWPAIRRSQKRSGNTRSRARTTFRSHFQRPSPA